MVSFADKPIVEATTAAEWERILETAPDTGVRLKQRKATSSAPGITWAEAVDVALCHGWIDGQAGRLDDDYTLQAYTPRRARSSWSQVNVENVARLAATGRMRPAGLAEVERAKADGRWDAAYRQKGAEAPEDLRAALDAVPAAAAFFDAATRVERFRVYFRLSRITRPATRAARIAEIVEHAARGEHRYR
jgi:uncharacterized protein YdeI (YjbR/CyaY-like superfamily)